MTTFAHHLILSDSEVIMLEEALKMMVALCNNELELSKSKGEVSKPPFWAYKHSAESLLQRLHSDIKQVSKNKFTPIKILIADEQKLYREAKKLAVNKVPHFQIVGEAVNFVDLIDKLNHSCPDILIVDDRIFKDDMLVYISEIKKQFPKLKTLATSYYEEDIRHLKVLKGIFDGLLVGAIEEDEFIKGVNLVLSGKPCYWHQWMWHQ